MNSKYLSVLNENNFDMQPFSVTSSSTPKPSLTPPPAAQISTYSGNDNLYYQQKYNYQSPVMASTSTPIQTASYSLYTNSTPIVSPQFVQQTPSYYIDPSYQYQFQNTEACYGSSSQFIDSNYFSKTNSVLGSYEVNCEKTNQNRNIYYDDSAVGESPISASNTKNKLFTIDSILNDKRTDSNNYNKENIQPLMQPKNEESNDEFYENQVKNNSKKGGRSGSKRIRTIFTQDQLDRLEVEFMKQQYMVGSERYYLANELNLNEAQVKIWFQNRRIKWRKENIEQKRSGKCSKQKDAENDNSISYQPQSPSLLNESISNQ